jgi:hypothetical protein
MTAAAEPFRQVLPDLPGYRRELAAAGARVPLPEAPWRPEGLLGMLPPSPGRRGWPWDVQTSPFAEDGAGWPKISIVTPSFRQGDYLEETLRSVLLQNYPHLEFIVMDGGSPDASPAIIARYRLWLSFARVAPDRGQSHAINLGFSLASGDLYGWLNSDDFYLPGALRRVGEAWRRGARGFLYGDSLSLDEATRRFRHNPALFAHERYLKFPGLVPSHGSFWAGRSHQPLWEEQHCALDYELWIRLLPGLPRRHLRWPLAVSRLHAAAKSFDPALKRQWDEDAARNGRAHPELYRSRPWLDREFRLVQRAAARWRRRGEAARLEALRRECGWSEPIAASTATP